MLLDLCDILIALGIHCIRLLCSSFPLEGHTIINHVIVFNWFIDSLFLLPNWNFFNLSICSFYEILPIISLYFFWTQSFNKPFTAFFGSSGLYAVPILLLTMLFFSKLPSITCWTSSSNSFSLFWSVIVLSSSMQSSTSFDITLKLDMALRATYLSDNTLWICWFSVPFLLLVLSHCNICIDFCLKYWGIFLYCIPTGVFFIIP